MVISDNQLLKHISGLTKQIKALKVENEQLLKENQLLVQRLNNRIEPEKVASPKSLNNEKNRPQSKTLKFKMATLMFANIRGFEKLNEVSDSSKLMDQLDSAIFQFDDLLEKYNINKIKTIGDTYMAAGGIPVKNSTNPVQVVMSALQIRNYVKNKQKEIGGSADLLRVGFGIHTGSVTAGLSGRKKINYDIKGDTVNIVSRMESMSDGNILISVMSYELVKEFFDCEYYGKMPVKYKGHLELFKVIGLKPEFQLNNDPEEPNDEFSIKLKLIQLHDIQEILLDKLEKELPEKLYYHNVKHTVDVMTQVELIGFAEALGNSEMLILKTAALFHDAGHIISYDDHEYHSTVLAREILPQFGYTINEIDWICEIILATKLPPTPKNLIERIICDADLDYLGRSDMIPVSNTLFQELKERNKIANLNDWNKLQLKFISSHQYFTKTARRLREVNKQNQIARIKSMII